MCEVVRHDADTPYLRLLFLPTLLLQVTDGAAAALLMTREEALRRGLPILGIFRSFAAVGVDPAVMGIGPAVAIPAALKLAGLKVEDIDVYEINEAFASQVSHGSSSGSNRQRQGHTCGGGLPGWQAGDSRLA